MGTSTSDHQEALAAAAAGVFAQCQRLLTEVSDHAYQTSSSTIRGGTIGKHLRHVLDHYSALFNGLEHGPVVYDRRERCVAMESDRSAAQAAIRLLNERIPSICAKGLDTPVRVCVMVSGDGHEVELRSTLGRELAFATHHAVHHQAMMRTIAAEFGFEIHDHFGKAPSTILHETGTRP